MSATTYNEFMQSLSDEYFAETGQERATTKFDFRTLRGKRGEVFQGLADFLGAWS